jgi:hypothetical protein
VLEPEPQRGKPSFDLASPGLRLILTAAIDALDAEDHRERLQLIKKGTVSNRARYVGLDAATGFAAFDWAGKPLILVNPAILP